MPLPTNIAGSYPDRGPGDLAHQEHHDTVHAAVNEVNEGRLTEAALSATFDRAGVATTDRGLGASLQRQGVVLTRGAVGAFDEDFVESPAIMRDPKSGRWVMVYVGYNLTPRANAGYAYSDDLVNWSKQGVLLAHTGVAGDPDQNGVSGPVLYWDNANQQYVLFYIGLTGTGYEGGTKTICMATADTLSGTWTRHGTIIEPEGTGWRGDAVYHVSVVQRANTWYMFFNAKGADLKEYIGYATAPNLTGPWVVDDANSPIISPVAGTWEADKVGDPSVRRVGDLWVMDYFGYSTATALGYEGMAVTTDDDFPLGWVKHPHNPTLAPAGETYDDVYAHKPFTVVSGGETLHYYTADGNTTTRSIALATSRPASLPNLATAAPVLGSIADGSAVASLLASLRRLGLRAYPDKVVEDTFYRSNSATLGTVSDGGFTWVTSGGAGWKVGGYAADWSGTTDGVAAINTAVSDNYAIEMKLREVRTDLQYPVTILARGDSATTYVKIYRRNSGPGYWYLHDGASPSLKVVAAPPRPGDTLRVEVEGTTYRLYVNGFLAATWTGITAHNTASDTYQGVIGSGNAPLVVENFVVHSI